MMSLEFEYIFLNLQVKKNDPWLLNLSHGIFQMSCVILTKVPGYLQHSQGTLHTLLKVTVQNPPQNKGWDGFLSKSHLFGNYLQLWGGRPQAVPYKISLKL